MSAMDVNILPALQDNYMYLVNRDFFVYKICFDETVIVTILDSRQGHK